MRQVDISTNILNVNAYIDVIAPVNQIFRKDNVPAIVSLSIKTGPDKSEKHITADAYMLNGTLHATLSPITTYKLNPEIIALLADSLELKMKKRVDFKFRNITYLNFE